MANIFLILCVSFSLLINGIDSLTVVNNVTVSSDILSEIFIQEITSNNGLLMDSSPIIVSKEYNSRNCILEIQEIIRRLPSLEVLPFIDSWGKLPSGILYGNFYSLGNFDQCTKTSIVLNESVSSYHVNGQYCLVNVPLISKQSKNIQISLDLEEQSSTERASFKDTDVKLRIGICIPESCSPDLLTEIFQQAVSKLPNGALSKISVSQCTNGKRPELEKINIAGITVFSIFGALMIASSLYEYITTHYQKSTQIPVLLAFSVLTNGKKLFAINTKSSPNNIDCLTGVRVITMMWIVYSHTCMQANVAPAINKIEMLPWMTDFWSMTVENATVSVDTFFFISGLLVAWLGFRELDKTGGKLNIFMMYVHRYIRLTPPVAAVLLFKVSINKLLYTGPLREDFLSKVQCNSENWWPVLLYIPNYFIQEPRCFDVTWYLDVDFQLYILSPLLLIPMWKYGRKFAPVLLILSLSSIACVMVIYYESGYTGLLSGTNPGNWARVYVPTHTRCSPWLIGLGFGYFMHVNRQRKFHIPKIFQLLGWIGCFAILFAIVFGPYFTVDADGRVTMLEAALYEAWRRPSWAIALCWLTFACHFGFGGLINSFLSHPCWQPLGRLSFCLYLIHLSVININFGSIRSEIFFSDYHMMLQFWSAFGISLTFAIVLTLAFESPVFVLEKFIFGHQKANKKLATESKDLNQVCFEISKTEK